MVFSLERKNVVDCMDVTTMSPITQLMKRKKLMKRKMNMNNLQTVRRHYGE